MIRRIAGQQARSHGVPGPALGANAGTGLIEFSRRVEQLQHNGVVHLSCRPVREGFVRLAVLTGGLPARDFDRNPEADLGCE